MIRTPIRSRGAVLAIIVLPLLLVGYVLSSGPAVWMVTYDWMSFGAYSTVYAPLGAIESQYKPLGCAARWYRERFIPKGIWAADYPEMRCGS